MSRVLHHWIVVSFLLLPLAITVLSRPGRHSEIALAVIRAIEEKGKESSCFQQAQLMVATPCSGWHMFLHNTKMPDFAHVLSFAHVVSQEGNDTNNLTRFRYAGGHVAFRHVLKCRHAPRCMLYTRISVRHAAGYRLT